LPQKLEKLFVMWAFFSEFHWFLLLAMEFFQLSGNVIAKTVVYWGVDSKKIDFLITKGAAFYPPTASAVGC